MANQTTKVFQVKVTKVGQGIKSVTVEEGATVEDALRKAKVDVDAGHDLRIGGKPVQLNHVVAENDLIIVNKEVKGGIA